MKYKGSTPICAKKVESQAKKESEGRELSYNENLMAEHLEVYDIGESKLKEMKKELEKVVGEETAIKICDVIPINKETIKTILLNYNDDIEEKLIDETYGIIRKYL